MNTMLWTLTPEAVISDDAIFRILAVTDHLGNTSKKLPTKLHLSYVDPEDPEENSNETLTLVYNFFFWGGEWIDLLVQRKRQNISLQIRRCIKCRDKLNLYWSIKKNLESQHFPWTSYAILNHEDTSPNTRCRAWYVPASLPGPAFCGCWYR